MVILQISRTISSFTPIPESKINSHKKNINIFDFLTNGSNDFNKILWVYSTFETKQYDIIGFSRKNPWDYKKVFNFLSLT